MGYQLRLLNNCKNIEAPVLINTKTRFSFSDSSLLLDKVIVYAIGISITTQKTLNYYTPFDIYTIFKTFITLSGSNNNLFNSQLSLRLFVRHGQIGFIKPKIIDFTKSFIEIPDIANVVIPPGGYSLPLTIFYEVYNPEIHKLNSDGELIQDF